MNKLMWSKGSSDVNANKKAPPHSPVTRLKIAINVSNNARGDVPVTLKPAPWDKGQDR